jgi:Dolichyl-phosphate-mannose-protein mannosyltransferase
MKDNLKQISSTDNLANTGGRARIYTLFTPVLLMAVMGWEFGMLLLEASRKPFWYDELLTFHVSGLHPYSLLWKALRAGVDGMPPVYYAIVQLSRMLPGDPHITLRLPSILGYILALLAIYKFARKRLSVLAGLTAMLLLALSPFRAYALEARSYSLLVGVLAISAVFWQKIGDKRFMTPLFGVFLILAVSCHPLAVVAISCFGVAELAWTLLWRRFRWGVWAACLIATIPFFAGLPLLLQLRQIFGNNVWSRSNWSMLTSTYSDYLELDERLTLVLIVLLGMVIGASAFRTFQNQGDEAPEHFGLPEIVLVGAFVFYPALLVVLTRLLNSNYTPRYGWPAVFGLILGLVYLARSTWAPPSYLVAVLFMVFAVHSLHDFKTLPNAGSTTVEARWAGLAALSRDASGIPVVIGSGSNYLEAVQYSPPELQNRLVDVVDAETATRLVGSDAADNGNLQLAEFIPLQVEPLAPFERANDSFILYSGGPYDWFTKYLLIEGYHLRLVATDDHNATYIVER